MATEIYIVNEEHPKIHRTQIEFIVRKDGKPGYAWDIMTGCKNIELGLCPGGSDYHCWAKAIALGRAKAAFPHGFEPTLYPNRFTQPIQNEKPSLIGVCFKADLFGSWVDPEMVLYPKNPELTLKDYTKHIVTKAPQHSFLFLTKNPEGYLDWGEFPDNAYLGFTANTYEMLSKGAEALRKAKAKHKWLIFEPVLSLTFRGPNLTFWLKEAGVEWLVIGGFSDRHRMKNYKEVLDLVEAANRLEIPVWLKDNLKPTMDVLPVTSVYQYGSGKLRHELPRGVFDGEKRPGAEVSAPKRGSGTG